MTNITITQELVKVLFTYHDGLLYWNNKPSYKIKAGTIAGNLNNRNGVIRRKIRINNKCYYAARLIFLYHKGYMPPIVDHANNITYDDRIENLRESDFSGNSRNRTSAKNSSSKYLGVSYCKKRDNYKSGLKSNNQKIYLGSFKKESDAALAYNKGAVKYHGEFANLNIIKP